MMEIDEEVKPSTLVHTGTVFTVEEDDHDVHRHCSQHLLSPHPNVKLLRFRTSVREDLDCHACTAHSTDLDQLLTEYTEDGYYLSDEFRKSILLHVTHGLHHIHECQLVHGRLVPENILFPGYSAYGTEAAHAVISDCLEEDEESGNQIPTQQDDIKQLGEIFNFVLKNGDIEEPELICRDRLIADKLIRKIMGGDISTEGILRDPYFWSDDKKVNFVMRSYDILKPNRKETDLDRHAAPVEDWAYGSGGQAILDLTDSELDRCQKLRSNGDDCGTGEITTWVMKKYTQRKKISHLVRFFRNTKEHFHEYKGPFKWSFENNETEKYWNYFTRRYPNLFCHVHKVMEKNRFLRLPGFKEIYLDAFCENRAFKYHPDKEKIPIHEYEEEHLPIQHCLYF